VAADRICAVHPDDERIAKLLPALRRELGLTQRQLADAAGIPREDVQVMEAGRGAEVKLGRIRRVMNALDGRARLVVTWRGALADRLVDEGHAAIVEPAVDLFRRRGWQTLTEVSYSEYGERGSIDIFAAKLDRRAVAVCEVKSVIGSLEETNRTLDAKERLAPKLAQRRFGWLPRVAGRLLILPHDASVRRIVEGHSATLASVYPGRGREVRSWLRDRTDRLAAIWFVSVAGNAGLGRR
jgi:predicted transcriptional regulator